MTVVVEGTQIRSVQPASSAAIPGGARRIDGSGKYLIPGLQDSHVHLTKAGESSLALFVANGVTSVRDVGSDLEEVSEWREEIEAGELVGPRITTSGQILESRANVDRMKREGGVEPVDRIRMPVGNPEEARAAVRKLKAGGADHIKLRTTPDPATFRAAAEEAKKLGLPLAMHPIAGLEAMIRAGVASVEHNPSFTPLDKLTTEQRRALFARAASAGMFLSTTLSNIDGSILVPYETAQRRMRDDPLRKYVCGYIVEDWNEQVGERKDGMYDEFRKTLPGLYRDVREMKQAGVRVIAGTDVGVLFMYPGFALHDELAKLVEHAAFTPMEALRAATYDAAGFHGSEKKYGSIAARLSADLVLLNADPLQDIRNTTRIHGVMAQGRWFDRASLDRLLKEVETGCEAVL